MRNRILVRAKYVLPFSTTNRSQVIGDGYILTEGPVVKEIGAYHPSIEAKLKGEGPLEVVGSTGASQAPMLEAVVMPSPKFGHTHFHESALIGRFRDLALLRWLDRAVNPHTRWMFDMHQGIITGKWADPSYKEIAKRLGKSPYEIVFAKTLLDVLRNGSSFVAVHHCNFTKYDGPVDAVVQILENAKATAIVFPGAQDQYYTPDSLLDRDPKEAAGRVKNQMQRHWNNRYARVMPGADQIFSNSNELLAALKAVARDMEHETGNPVFFHIHSSENAGAVSMVLTTTGLTPVGRAAQAGILDERTVVAHQVHTSSQDLELLKSRGVNVISNPTANGSLFSGIAPVGKFIEDGIPVAYSTDGSGSSDHQDIFAVMATGVNMNRGSEREGAAVLTCQQALEMIIVTPARIYGFNADSLDPGKDASYVVFDLDPAKNPYMVPNSPENIVDLLVFGNPSGRNIIHSLSRGEWMVSNGKVVTMDADMILREIQLLGDIYWNEVYPKLSVQIGTGGT